ncbi:hypothetical protein SASPL_127130 [Salvia splendens]|uniref:Uncharacterized protein n=1 Tax=Salvia splendens TaxID=180675 RepID=A0A8X8XM47_SALSN|nr:hypothetical protein SASPL_127130 [Salvia splendens]
MVQEFTGVPSAPFSKSSINLSGFGASASAAAQLGDRSRWKRVETVRNNDSIHEFDGNNNNINSGESLNYNLNGAEKGMENAASSITEVKLIPNLNFWPWVILEEIEDTGTTMYKNGGGSEHVKEEVPQLHDFARTRVWGKVRTREREKNREIERK